MVYCNVDICDLTLHTQMQFDMLTVPGNNEFKIVQVNKNVDMTWSNKNIICSLEAATRC